MHKPIPTFVQERVSGRQYRIVANHNPSLPRGACRERNRFRAVRAIYPYWDGRGGCIPPPLRGTLGMRPGVLSILSPPSSTLSHYMYIYVGVCACNMDPTIYILARNAREHGSCYSAVWLSVRQINTGEDRTNNKCSHT